MTDWHPDPDQLVALALADPDSAEAERLVAHLAGCAPCRDDYGEFSDGLQQTLAAAPSVAPPAGFSGRVLAAMLPAPSSAASPAPQRRPRIRVLAAAAALGLVVGVGGTMTVSSWLGRPPDSGTQHPPVAASLVTSAGETVGSVGIATRSGRSYLLLNVTSGRPGASYECFLVDQEGQRSSGGRWSLTTEYGAEAASGSWLVPLDGEPPVGVELVAPSGAVWARGRL